MIDRGSSDYLVVTMVAPELARFAAVIDRGSTRGHSKEDDRAAPALEVGRAC